MKSNPKPMENFLTYLLMCLFVMALIYTLVQFQTIN